jgi:putative DNA primase/helicase
MLNNEITVQIQSAMVRAGIDCPEDLIFICDGKIHRFGTKGDKGKPCWYVIHVFTDGFVWCSFGCWKRCVSETWHNHNQGLSEQEKNLIKQKKEQLKMELQERQARAKKSVNCAWDGAQQSFAAHPYLTRKQVKSFGLRLYKGLLLIPLYNENRELCSLQFINSEGAKWFKQDTHIKGCFFPVGNVDGIIYIAEGYATAAAIHEATSRSVIVAFSAHNLLPVAKITRKQYSNAEIIICADNDAFGGVK